MSVTHACSAFLCLYRVCSSWPYAYLRPGLRKLEASPHSPHCALCNSFFTDWWICHGGRVAKFIFTNARFTNTDVNRPTQILIAYMDIAHTQLLITNTDVDAHLHIILRRQQIERLRFGAQTSEQHAHSRLRPLFCFSTRWLANTM